jgi:hypothetical protein
MATVTGRSYTRTRPRGFAEWRPQARSRELLDQVEEILTEYRDLLPVTLRQVFYSLVGRYGYDKTEAAYDRLGELVNRARRARLIPMHAIRDDGVSAHYAGGFTGPASFWQTVESMATYYERDLGADQPRRVELWVEAAGMAPQVARVARGYGVDVYSSGGFDSTTAKYGAAARIADEHRPVLVIQIGDHDPSGCSVIDSAAEDVAAFVTDLGGTPPEFSRLAVTPAQIRRHSLPSAPQKAADRRGAHMAATVQAEALPPEALAAEVEAALRRLVNLRTLATTRRRADRERAELLGQLARHRAD